MLWQAARYIAVSLALLAGAVGQSATAQTQPSFTWEVFGPPPTGIAWDGRAIPLRIVVGPRAATDVALAQPLLTEHDSLLPVEFQLCQQRGQGCTMPPTLLAGRSYLLFLRPVNGAVPAGNYGGSLIVTAADKPDGKSVQMSLYVTSWTNRGFGLLAIAAGVMLAWLLTIAVRNMIGRKELQRLLAGLRHRRDRLDAALAVAYGSAAAEYAPRTFAGFRSIENELSEAAALLPPAIPTPWQGQWSGKADFEVRVSAMDERLDRLAIVVEDGLVPAAPDGDKPVVRAAISKIDAKADKVGTETLAELSVAVSGLLAAAYGQPSDAASGAALEIEKLGYEILLLGALSWGVILVTTMLVGMVALVLPDRGFGQWQDYVICLLWGLGVPVAGGQLTSLGADSVRTAIKVTQPG